jgi:putative FmdB family regulatory protein
MPTYTYSCTECENRFDLFHSIKDDSEKQCPICNSVAKRQMGVGVGLIFKGSGFYETDYKNKKNGNGNGKVKPSKQNGTSETISASDKDAKTTDSDKKVIAEKVTSTYKVNENSK